MAKKTKLLILAALLCLIAIGFFAKYNFSRTVSSDEKVSSRISDKTANAFFDECMSKEYPTVSNDAQMETCACQVVELQETFTPEEYDIFQKTPESGSETYMKFLTYVQGPCMEHPVRYHIETKCLEDDYYKKHLPNITKMCSCTSEALSRYAYLNAPDILAAQFANNPDFGNAITPLMESSEFVQEKQSVTEECLKKQAYYNRTRKARKSSGRSTGASLGR